MNEGNAGKLYIVATPIGNLGDITLRALEVLKQVDIVCAEDTRRTAKLLNHYEIKKKLLSFHEHSSMGRYEEVIGMLLCGKEVALLSDAGTPLISDPGYELVRQCAVRGISVESLPGPCAAVTALTVSGIPARQFLFVGFLNSKQGARKKELKAAAQAEVPVVIYESPNRVIKTIADICEIFGENTGVSVARELTKLHEEVFHGSAKEAFSHFSAKEAIKGEFVLIVDVRQDEEVQDEKIEERLEGMLASGMSSKTAAAAAADEFGIAKNRAYKLLLAMKEEGGEDCEK